VYEGLVFLDKPPS